VTAKIDPQRFLDALLPVVRQCAEASLIFYGNVADLGKAADTTLRGSRAQLASGVLTALDTALQDIILTVVLQYFPQVRLIAEEDTPLKRRFRGNRDAAYAVILDPIDGTFHYQRGDASYHICVGLAHDGVMQAAIVARPDENKIFSAIRGQGAYVQVGRRRPRRLRLPKTPRTNAAFISTKARIYQEPARPRLDPRESPIGAALVLTLLAEGDLCAYLTRQVEIYDVGPPSLIAEEAGARCFLKGGRSPVYRQRRKFGHYMAAATPELEAYLHDVVRIGARIEARRGDHS
jgi:myo-inositol-1(or 4)-monophosphatase